MASRSQNQRQRPGTRMIPPLAESENQRGKRPEVNEQVSTRVPATALVQATDDDEQDLGDEDPFGRIKQSEEYLECLRSLAHSAPELLRAGYVISQLSDADIDKKRRCQKCCRILPAKLRKVRDLREITKAPIFVNGVEVYQETERRLPQLDYDASGFSLIDKDPQPSNRKSKKTEPECKYHPGQVAYKAWTCCRGNLYAPPCTAQDNHTPMIYPRGELEKEWRYGRTPNFVAKVKPAAAVVLDCEMGAAASGESELIRVSVIDYFTKNILLDTLVYPDVKMAHLRTKYSGVSRKDLEDAKRRRTCIFGRDNARMAVWQFVGPETIVIGHAGQGDLSSLRWIHPCIIDTLVIEGAAKRKLLEEAEAAAAAERALRGEEDENSEDEGEASEKKQVHKQPGGLSLKALALERLGRTIQIKNQGHDSLEDAIATRDILHWNVKKILEGLRLGQGFSGLQIA